MGSQRLQPGPTTTKPPPRRSAAHAPTKRPIPSPAKRSTKRSNLSIDTLTQRSDRLGTLISELTARFSSAESWKQFVLDFRGPSYLSSELEDLDHPATPLLAQWRDQGVPAKSSSEPWTLEQKDECIRRGCHPSANEHGDFIREEMAEFIENRFWAVLPYDLVRHLENLMLSPAAIKPERDRKPRLLCDHSWPWPWGSINGTTIPHAPPGAMQFGGTLHRVLHVARHANPRFGPVRGCKHDLKDGFYKMALNPDDCLRLALLLPKFEGEPQLIGIPLACTMGWVESPPTFSAMSETFCDVANTRFQAQPLNAEPHRLSSLAQSMDDDVNSSSPAPKSPDDIKADEALASVPGVVALLPEPDHIAPPSNRPFQRPVGITDVFVDDFIQVGQGGTRRMNSLRDHLLHAIDGMIAQPEDASGNIREPASVKKMSRGDGSWNSRKVILGWTIDFVRQTLELPAHRKHTLATIFTELAGVKRIARKRWQRILGQLRFVSQAIPGSAGLFGALQLALQKATSGRVRINTSLRYHLTTFASLAASLCHRPTHLAEITPEDPRLAGTTDAAKPGMGGIYYCPKGLPHVWRFPFPLEIQKLLVSADNPTGVINNSDLEHAGQIGQVMIMA